jgi:stress response protein YsnF
MSDLCTIAFGSKFRLYERNLKKDKVHVRIENVDFKVKKFHEKSFIEFSVPVEQWREMVEAWQNSEWGQDKNIDRAAINESTLENIALFLSEENEYDSTEST